MQGFGTFYAKTDAATAAQLKDENPLPMDDPGAGPDRADPTTSTGDAAGGDQVDAGHGLDPAGVGPQSAGELAGLLPTLIPAVLGAAGGLVGGVMSTLTKAPEALAQAAGAAVQGVSGALGPGNDRTDGGGTDSGLPDDSSAFSGDGVRRPRRLVVRRLRRHRLCRRPGLPRRRRRCPPGYSRAR